MENSGLESPPAKVRRHDSPHQSGSFKSHEMWFATEIQQMMHGFGDCRKPLLQSAELIETIVHEQMSALLIQASEVNMIRNGRYLGLEDLLFIMRKSKSKLRRLIRYLELKDLKAAALKGTSIDEDENGEQEVKAARKRRKVCYDFLSTIDQTGELLAIFDDQSPDEVKVERALRAELQTRHMDPNQYMQYCEAKTNQLSEEKNCGMLPWLLGVSMDHYSTWNLCNLFPYIFQVLSK